MALSAGMAVSVPAITYSSMVLPCHVASANMSGAAGASQWCTVASEGRAEAEKIFKEMQMPSPYMLYLCAAVCQGPYCKRIWKLDV